jgi:restriction system protein
MESVKFSNSASLAVWIIPLLDALKMLGGSGRPREVSDKIAEMMGLPESITNEMLPSGVLRFHNRIAWARNYLAREGYLDSSVRGVWVLTEKGKNAQISKAGAEKLVKKWLEYYKKRRAASQSEKTPEVKNYADDMEAESPNDAFSVFSSPDLIETLNRLSPRGFEHVCARLLRESGFENVVVTGRAHDGGIDGEGVLEINPFLTLKVVFQCKRYKGAVSREQVSDFENRTYKTADKGIFITTGYFSADALKEAHSGGKRQLELIDGEKLVEMFKRAELGVRPVTVYEVDHEFFRHFEEQQIGQKI